MAFQALGESDAADSALAACLALAEPADYVQLFVEAGRPLRPLLARAAVDGCHADYAGRLLAALDRALGPASPAKSVSLVEPLTPRETEVLQLICAGLSNRAIAERLVVSLSTVKKHSGNVYGKLGVNSRTQAIIRAQELNLV
jgi:LuxR family maltose regulon positive regulatory protein